MSELEKEVESEAVATAGPGRPLLPTDRDHQKKVYYILSTPIFEGFNPRKDPLNNLIMRCESGLFKAPGTLTQNQLYRQKIKQFAEVWGCYCGGGLHTVATKAPPWS